MIKTSPNLAQGLLSKGWLWLSFGVVTAGLLLLGMDYTLERYDECLVLYGSVRFLHGELPYRDFWTMYGPGQFAVLAGLFKLFGIHAILGRAFYALSTSLTLAMVLVIVKGLTGSLRAAFLTTLLILSMLVGMQQPSYDFPVYQALGLTLAAAACMTRHWRTNNPRWAACSGILVGVTLLFRHDIAFYAFVALLLATLHFHLSVDKQDRRAHIRPLLRDTTWFIAGVFLIGFPTGLWLLLHIPRHDLAYDLFYVPGRVYPKVRSLPFPHPREVAQGFQSVFKAQELWQGPRAEDNIVWIPLLAIWVDALCVLPRRLRDDLTRWQTSTYVLLMSLTALLFLKGLVRVEPLHMVQATVPALVLYCCLLTRWRRVNLLGQLAQAFLGIWLVACLVSPWQRGETRMMANAGMLRHPHRPGSLSEICHRPADLERADCMLLPADLTETAVYVEQHTVASDRIFVGAGRHDKLFANDLAVYFVSERDSATKWHDLHPGVQTTMPIQDEMIAEFENHHAAYVVENTFLDYKEEPNASRFSSGVFDLDRYIAANYTLEKVVGSYRIMRRSTPF